MSDQNAKIKPLTNTANYPKRWALGQEVAADGSKSIIIATEDMEAEVFRVVIDGDSKYGTRAVFVAEYLIHLHNEALAAEKEA